MSYPSHSTARGRRPPANVIPLPRRAGGHPARRAAEPLDAPRQVLDLLQRAEAELTFAQTVLQPETATQRTRGRPDGCGPAVRGAGARPGHPAQPLAGQSHSHVEIRLLGCFQVTRAGQPVSRGSFRGRRPRQLLQILLMERGSLVPKDVLIEALWPGKGPADPGANLGVLVSRARHALGEASLILGRRGGYLYAGDDRSWVDTEAFAREAGRGRLALASGNAGAAAQAYQAALRLWKGDPFMENMYTEWAQDFRRRFALLHEEALAGLARASLELGHVTTAVDAARQLSQRAPLREEGHVLLMNALAAGGDPAAAIGVFHAWRHRLASELGVDPSREARDVFQRILLHEPLGYPPPLPQRTGPPGGQPGAGEGLATAVLGWIPDAVYVLDRDDRVVYANPAGALAVGMPAGCLPGMAACEVFPPDWLAAYRRCAGIALAAKAPSSFRAFCVPLDSWLEWTVCPGERGLLVTSRNVTRLVEAADRVRQALTAVEASRSELHDRTG
jgi:DNA-binding SARP family transcriptional activator